MDAGLVRARHGGLFQCPVRRRVVFASGCKAPSIGGDWTMQSSSGVDAGGHNSILQ